MLSDFHFIRPLWLAALIAIPLLIWLVKRIRIKSSGWQQFIPKHLAIGIKDSSFKQSTLLPSVVLIYLLTITALAGPTWKKLPQPVYQVAKGSVLLMDMSYSMYATDVAPNRLTQARYKATDLLNSIQDGEIGLIAYAGDAFTISPLTSDVENIKLLLPSLSPELMPELGSNPFAALDLAKQMLVNAGHQEGDIYWFTDGVEFEEVEELQSWNKTNNYRVNILATGTSNGAPIRLNNGELMKDRSGGIIIPKVNIDMLKGIATAGAGNFSTMTTSNRDLEILMQQPAQLDQDKKEAAEKEGDQWQDFGAFLVIAVALLMLPLFRRGALLITAPLALLLLQPTPVQANIWNDLWKTKDQQGQTLYDQGEFSKAAEAFKNPMWQGNAHYKAGDYEAAISAYDQVNNADALYNKGNSLAKLQQLDKALEAYENALEMNPDHENAKRNKKLIEDLIEQQKQNEPLNDQGNEDHESKKDDQQKNSVQQDGQDDKQQQKNQSDEDADMDKQNLDQPKEGEQDQSQQSEADEQEQQEAQEKQSQEQQAQEQGEGEEQESKAQQMMQEQLDKEQEQKYQQIMNKVTDDPYLLLRNKMQLEYQKRRQNRSSIGETKKW